MGDGIIDPNQQDPSAQGGQSEAQTPEVVQEQPNGVQQRINELVAKQHEWERRFQQSEEQNHQLIAMLMQQQRQASPQPDPYAGVELDPDDERKIQKAVAPHLQQLQQMQRQMQAQFEMNQVQQMASVYGDPRVTDLATKLLSDWRRKGLDGWLPEDAIDHALGLITKADRQKRTGQGQQHEVAPQVLTQQSVPQAFRQPSVRLPSNFDNLSTDKQIELLEKEGLDDLPL